MADNCRPSCRRTSRRAAGAGLAAALAAALLWCVCGCEVGPNYTPPQTTMPAAYGEPSGGVSSRTADLSAWWKSFKDPVLDDLIAKASGGNLDVKQARARVRQARAAGDRGGGALPHRQLHGVLPARRRGLGGLGRGGRRPNPGCGRDRRDLDSRDDRFDGGQNAGGRWIG